MKPYIKSLNSGKTVILCYNSYKIPPPHIAQHSPAGQSLFNIGLSQSHSNTPSSVGLLSTSDQPDAETSTWQHTTLTTDIFASRRVSNPQPQEASGRRPTPQTARPLGTALQYFNSVKLLRQGTSFSAWIIQTIMTEVFHVLHPSLQANSITIP